MLPTLVELDLPFGIKLPIYSYGLMMLVGFLAAYLLASRLAKGTGIKNGDIFDAGFVAIIAGIVGAKISYFMHSPDYFRFYMSDPIKNLAYLSGGLDFFGGLIAAVPAVLIYLLLKGYRPLAFGDIAVAGIAVGHAFGRIGCFLNGCCYGFQSDSSGLAFPSGSAVYFDHLDAGMISSYAIKSLPVFPSQLLESGLLFLLTLLLVGVFKSRKFAGRNLALYLMCYGIIRFVVQFTRADEAIQVGPLTIWHVVALGVVLSGVALYFVAWKSGYAPSEFLRTPPEPAEVKDGPPQI